MTCPNSEFHIIILPWIYKRIILDLRMRGTYIFISLSVCLPVYLSSSFLSFQNYWGKSRNEGHKGCYSLVLKQPISKHTTSFKTQVVSEMRILKLGQSTMCTSVNTLVRGEKFPSLCRLWRLCPPHHPRNVLILCPERHAAVFVGSQPGPQSPPIQAERDPVK